MNSLAIAVLCGIGLGVKFSGVILFPIVAVLLLIRVFLPEPWQMLGREVVDRRARTGIVVALGFVVALVSFVIVWASYGFRFDPTETPGRLLDLQYVIERSRPGVFVNLILWMQNHKVFPQAWLYGLLYTHQSEDRAGGIFAGRGEDLGMVVLLSVCDGREVGGRNDRGVVVCGHRAVLEEERRRRARRFKKVDGVVSVRTRRRLRQLGNGVESQHRPATFPAGLSVSVFDRRDDDRPRNGGSSAAHARPDGDFHRGVARRIPFGVSELHCIFQRAGRRGEGRNSSSRGFEFRLGARLKSVAIWQQDHPNTTLYLSYFGSADPTAYGITYVNLPGGFAFGPKPQMPTQPGVIAISATNLQGIYLKPEDRKIYIPLRDQKPIELLGGTIYLFDFPAQTEVSALFTWPKRKDWMVVIANSTSSYDPFGPCL